jgi:hypothetical protein
LQTQTIIKASRVNAAALFPKDANDCQYRTESQLKIASNAIVQLFDTPLYT